MYTDDTIMQSQNKIQMFTILNEYHILLRKAGLKANPQKTFFFLKNLKLLAMSFPKMENNLLQNE